MFLHGMKYICFIRECASLISGKKIPNVGRALMPDVFKFTCICRA
ncbi:hypothetical protein NEIELOOT_03140 [Neisseria elongata subsp. glycolytica ATCC 29315]|uniref:Uncharacterized protein n=1 Tax=Neisseria elongata subsp. glycolytica ATCC 29315 TaxID=546263 RepID=D4DVM2_NEIEG|nr:hypothetical protein NEIELOOT_03140 [Neisseria elongata subsp. glycolytica ATCC 29315]